MLKCFYTIVAVLALSLLLVGSSVDAHQGSCEPMKQRALAIEHFKNGHLSAGESIFRQLANTPMEGDFSTWLAIDSLENLAELYRKQGNFSRAIIAMQEATDRLRASEGAQSPRLVTLHWNMERLLLQQGREDLALAQDELALNILQIYVSPNSKANLGFVQNLSHRDSPSVKALPYMRRVYDIRHQSPGFEANSNSPDVCMELARDYLTAGHPQTARDLSVEAVRCATRSFGMYSVTNICALVHVAVCESKLGEGVESGELFSKAWRMSTNVVPDSEIDVNHWLLICTMLDRFAIPAQLKEALNAAAPVYTRLPAEASTNLLPAYRELLKLSLKAGEVKCAVKFSELYLKRSEALRVVSAAQLAELYDQCAQTFARAGYLTEAQQFITEGKRRKKRIDRRSSMLLSKSKTLQVDSNLTPRNALSNKRSTIWQRF